MDADEWVSPQLATEMPRDVAGRLPAPRSRTASGSVFQGTWIRHCGWYRGSWIVRLIDRRYAKYDGSLVGERVCVDGALSARCGNDIVDDDRKGLGCLAAQARALRGTGSRAPRPARRHGAAAPLAEIPGNVVAR